MICVVQQVQVGLPSSPPPLLSGAVMFRMMRRQTGDCIFSWLHHQHPASLVTTSSVIIRNIADCPLIIIIITNTTTTTDTVISTADTVTVIVSCLVR